jgi:hypothetical protein
MGMNLLLFVYWIGLLVMGNHEIRPFIVVQVDGSQTFLPSIQVENRGAGKSGPLCVCGKKQRGSARHVKAPLLPPPSTRILVNKVGSTNCSLVL